MLPITPCTLIALAFASCVAASTGSAPGGHPISQPPSTDSVLDGHLTPQPQSNSNDSTSTDDSFQYSVISSVLPEITKHFGLRTLARFSQTNTAWNALTSKQINEALRPKTIERLVNIISSAANDCATLNLMGVLDINKYPDFNKARDFNQVRDKLAVDLTRVRDQFKNAHADRNIDPVHLPSCAKIAPRHLNLCLGLLFSVAEHQPDVVKSDWVLLSSLDLVKKIMESNGWRMMSDPDWYLKFAEIHADHLLQKINMDDGWSRNQLDWLVGMLKHIEAHRKTDGQHVRHAISAVLCKIVSRSISFAARITLGYITGGVAMLKDILFYQSRYLAFEPAVISSNFLEYGMLYHDPSFQYNPQKGIGSLKPSLYDIIQGLLHAMDPQLSSADRMIFGEQHIRDFWPSYPAHRLEAASVVDALKNISQTKLAFAAINCALLGLRPPQGRLNMDEPSRVIMVKEWLKWHFLRFSLEFFAANGGMNLALEVSSLLEKNSLVPKWMDRNLLLSDLRNLPKVHQI